MIPPALSSLVMHSYSLVPVSLMTVHFLIIACTPILNQTSDDPLIPLIDHCEAKVEEGIKISSEESGYHGLTLFSYSFSYDDNPQRSPSDKDLDSYGGAAVHFEKLPKKPLWGGLVNYWHNDRWLGLWGEGPTGQEC